MATSVGIAARLSRSSKKQEMPYAFNSSSTALVSKLKQDGQLNKVEIVMHSVEQVSTLLTSGFTDQIKDNILNMCQHLKVYGACLEVLCKEQLDRAFVVFRNSSQDEEKLDYHSRLHLLELIELRANQWKGTDVMNSYYKKKGYTESDMSSSMLSESLSSASLDSSAFLSVNAAPLLGPGEIMKSSGKFSKPTRIPGKNYCKDEVVIRNADSGKVNPGAKERLVQITGASESSINHAKQLIEDTIRRNASPIRDPNAGVGALAGSSSSIASSASDDSALPLGGGAPGGGGHPSRTLLHSLSTGDATVGEYKYSVNVGGHIIKITGHNLELVRTSKLVLDEFFSGVPINDVSDFYNNFEALPRSPMSPLESNENEQNSAEILPNGQLDETFSSSVPNNPVATDVIPEYKPLRRPKLTTEDLELVSNNNNNLLQEEEIKAKVGVRCVYSIEFLVRMAMSPLCVVPPAEWARISGDHPSIARKVVEIFDAENYLSHRATMQHVLCTSASDESILSGSSA